MTDGQVSFSKVHDYWSLDNKSAALFTGARRVIRNAFDWISSEMRKCIEPDLVVLENQCIADLALSDVITPPDSQVEDKWKRRLSKMDQTGKNARSRSSSNHRKLDTVP